MYVDADGRVLALPDANSGRTVMIVEHGGERVARSSTIRRFSATDTLPTPSATPPA
jgi:hypothetical protein